MLRSAAKERAPRQRSRRVSSERIANGAAKLPGALRGQRPVLEEVGAARPAHEFAVGDAVDDPGARPRR